MDVSRIIFWTVFLGAGGLLCVVGVMWLVQRIRFRRNAYSTLGTVVGHEQKKCEDENTTFYYPVVEYQDANGKAYRVTMQVGSSWIPYPDNPRVTVLYEPGCPEQSVIRSFDGLWLGPCICTVLGAMLVGIVVLDWIFKFPINDPF